MNVPLKKTLSKRWVQAVVAVAVGACVPFAIVAAQHAPGPGGPGGFGAPDGFDGPNHPAPPPPLPPGGEGIELPVKLDPVPLDGNVAGFNYSPRGTVDGLMVRKGDRLMQINCPPDVGPAIAEAVLMDETVTLTAVPELGLPDHGVYNLATLKTAKGEEFTIDRPRGPREDHERTHLDGTIKQLNYGHHGEVDGALLDTGDFIHTGPEAAQDAKLAVGQKVSVDGFTRPMLTGHAAVEATEVNGVIVRPPPPGPGGPRGPGRFGPDSIGPDRGGPSEGADGGPGGPGEERPDGFGPGGGPGGPGGWGRMRRFGGPRGFGGPGGMDGGPDAMGGPGGPDGAGGFGLPDGSPRGGGGWGGGWGRGPGMRGFGDWRGPDGGAHPPRPDDDGGDRDDDAQRPPRPNEDAAQTAPTTAPSAADQMAAPAK